MARVPSDSVPSMPARWRCSPANSFPASRARAFSSATCSSCRRGVSRRRGARVQCGFSAHGLQSVVEKGMRVHRSPLVVAGGPALAGLPGRAGREMPAPVECEVLHGEGALGFGLPLMVLGRRPDQLDAVAARAGHQLVRIHAAGVYQGLARQQVPSGGSAAVCFAVGSPKSDGSERSVYRLERIAVHNRRGHRLDVGDRE